MIIAGAYQRGGGFYRKHLVGTAVGPALKQAFIFVENKVIAARRILRNRRANNFLAHARVSNLASVADFVDSRAMRRTCLFPAQAISLPTPLSKPSELASVLDAAEKKYAIEEIAAFELENVTAIGNSDLLILGDYTLHHGLYDFANDSTSEELHSRALISPHAKKIIWYQRTRWQDDVPEAISLLGSCTKNYAHWLSETLPKLAAIDGIADFATLPLLIDADLPLNIRRSIDHVQKHERRIIEVFPDAPVLVERLVFVEASGYVPFEPRNKHEITRRHGVFASAPIQLMLEQIRGSAGSDANLRHEKIFLRRNSAHRAIANDAEIEIELTARGYVVIEPEKLSFEEQVVLFSSAKIVVAATGAACANLLFIPSSAHFVILIAKHRHMPYYYWQAMAHAVNNEVAYVLGQPEGENPTSIHARFRIEIDALSELLDELE